MTTAIFKTPVAIGIYIIASLGILAIIGYNFWGWFGGSKKWREEHPDTGRRGSPDSNRAMSGVCVGGTRDGQAPHWLWGCPHPNERLGETGGDSDISERTASGSIPINLIPDWSNTKIDYEDENVICFRIAVGTSCPNKIKRFGEIYNRATKVPVGYEGWCCFSKNSDYSYACQKTIAELKTYTNVLKVGDMTAIQNAFKNIIYFFENCVQLNEDSYACKKTMGELKTYTNVLKAGDMTTLENAFKNIIYFFENCTTINEDSYACKKTMGELKQYVNGLKYGDQITLQNIFKNIIYFLEHCVKR